MELKLEKYPTKSLLASYEYVFLQYLGGQLSSREELEVVATPYIFGELCSELRMHYLAREDSKHSDMLEVEKSSVNRLCQMANIPEPMLIALCKDMITKSEAMLRNAGIYGYEKG